MRWLNFSWLFAFALYWFISSSLYAATEVELNEDESMIVELRLGSFMLSDAMVVYHNSERTLVSLQEFLDGVEFAITVDAETQQASGWFINTKNTFSLNIKTQEVHLRGEKIKLDDDFSFYADEFDLYVDIEYIKRWFDIDIDLQMARLIMQVTTKEPLPVEQRVTREKKRTKSNSNKSNVKAHPWIDDEYAWLGPPSLDLRIDASATQREEASERWGYSLQSTNDLLKHEMRLSHIQLDQESPSSTRLSFSKKAPRPDATLGVGLTQYEAGDIYARGDSLVTRGAPGVGINMERYLSPALDQSFNRRDFEGDAPPGWEVELYRNGLFVDFQEVDDSGRYIFKDIELQYGENFFEITRYGPQGQVETERKRVQIGQEMITPGEWQFSGTLLNVNDQMIGEPLLPSARPDDAKTPQSVAITGLYGVFDQHSFGFGYNRTPASFRTEEKDFARLIWISAFPLFSSRLDYAQDLDGGLATSINLSGRAFQQDINFQNIYFQDFLSEQSNFGNTKQKSKFTLFGSVDAFKGKQLPYSIGFNMVETADGTRRFNLENRVSLFLGRNRFSNEITAAETTAEDSIPTTRGAFSYNRSSGSFQFRTIVGYTLRPTLFTGASMTADYRRINWRAQASANVSRTVELGDVYSLGLNFSRNFGNFGVGLSALTDFNEANSIALSIDFGLSGHTYHPWIETARYGSSDMGALEARVFMDKNANGEFDYDEETLEGVRFKGRSTWQDQATNDEGIVVLNGMDTSMGSVVTMDALTLNDPYLEPSLTSFRVASHAGAYRKLDIPVTEITEVEGGVYIEKNGNQKPVGGATVALYKKGVLVARAKTEFDGYFLFPRVPPGEYTATLIDENGEMKKYRWEVTPTFETDVESGVTKIPDIIVRER
jgi:hypothetical protein